MTRTAKVLGSLLLIAVALLTSASGCQEDCPTLTNKGVCVNR